MVDTAPPTAPPGPQGVPSGTPQDGQSDAAERAFVRAVEAHRAGRLAEAQRRYGEALGHAPDHLQVLNNLGVLLRQRRRAGAAEACLRRALALDPANPGALANLANLLRDTQRLPEARAAFARAVEVAPDDGSLWQGLGRCQADLGETAAAVGSFGQALEKTSAEGRKPPIAWDLAGALLRSGDWANGFAAYESRWKLPEFRVRHADVPAWDGADPAGKRLLLWAEPGLGETLQSLRFVASCAALGAAVTLEVPSELVPLLQGLDGAARILPAGEATPDCDLQAPLGSLPRLLGATPETLPASIPYLPVPDAPAPLPTVPPGVRRVGLVWSGYERRRSLPGVEPGLARLLPLTAIPGIRPIGLQKGAAAAELVDCAAEGLIADVSARLETWRDMAAALCGLDLLVCVEGPAAHLAGALGRPAWVLLPYAADWRWGETGTRTPWYPSVRLFRQPSPGDWEGAVAALQAALAGWVREPAAA